MNSPESADVPTSDNRIDFTFILMGELASVLSAERGTAERYNLCMELSVLLHPYHDIPYRAFSDGFFKRPIEERVKATGAWLQALVDLLYRSGFLGRGDRGE